MPAPSATQLANIFSGRQKHSAYAETVKQYERIKFHANGECPTHLIHERRPNESEHILAYRKKIYVEQTKNPISKVLTELSKIRRSSDWKIQHPTDIPKRIRPDETLQTFCDTKFPTHDSIENFIFSVWLKEYCLSGNSVCAIIPDKGVVAANEYRVVKARVFSPDKVFVSPELGYVVLEDEEPYVELDTASSTYVQKKLFHVIDENSYFLYKQLTGDNYQLEFQLDHKIGELPAWKVKGSFLKDKCGIVIYDCRLDPMVASLDEAAREYSDMQAEVVQHIHSEPWLYTNVECKPCKGTGVVGKDKSCESCKGSGYAISNSPYSVLLVTPEKGNEKAMPTPPKGYVQRDVEIVKLQDERVDKHIHKALSGVNMEYLDQVPLNQSGKAKEVDRESLNNFVYSVAEDLVWNMNRAYYFSNEYRYAVIVPNKNDRIAMLPKINVPQYYDLLGSTYYLDKLTKATTANLNPAILSAMEYDFVGKEFYNDPKVSAIYKAIYDLDPLPGKSVDDKMVMLNNKAITQNDFVISCYIGEFVKMAIEQDESFGSKKMDEQRKVMKAFADVKIKEMSVASQLIPTPAPADPAPAPVV